VFGLVRTVLLILITVTVTVFFIQNLAATEVAFLTWSISAPRAVVFALIFALGWAAGYLVHAFTPQPKRRAQGGGAAERVRAPEAADTDL
jgi:uncharacterized integral membrane protein